MLERNEIVYLIIGAFLGYLLPKIDKIPKYIKDVKRRQNGDYNMRELYELSKKSPKRLSKKQKKVLINAKKDIDEVISKHSDILSQKR